MLECDAVVCLQQSIINPILHLDPMSLGQSLGHAQGVLPVSLSITDDFGNMADPSVAAKVLQGLEGLFVVSY